MRFFAIAAALVAVAAAQYSAEDTCNVVTVTITQTIKHTPSAPAPAGHTAPYPTTAVPYPSAPYPSVSVGTGYPVAGVSSGTAKPSGTAAYSAPYPEFTGAASGLKVCGVLAGVGAVAALLL